MIPDEIIKSTLHDIDMLFQDLRNRVNETLSEACQRLGKMNNDLKANIGKEKKVNNIIICLTN